MYEVEVSPRGEAARPLTVWVKAYFEAGELERYARAIRHLAGPSDPWAAAGCVRLAVDRGMFVFVYPADPAFPSLAECVVPERLGTLLAPMAARIASGGAIAEVGVTRVSYLPEIACVLRYRVHLTDPTQPPIDLFAKVQHSKAGALTYEVMRALWDLPARRRGELVLAEPVGYLPTHDLLLQRALPGEPLAGDRQAEDYRRGAEAAGAMLANLHRESLALGVPHPLTLEIERLKRSYEEFKLSAPRCYLLLRDLITHIEARAQRISIESAVPSHGDFKYDQLIHQDGRFGLLDFEHFCQAEPSFDLGTFAAHVPPSFPPDWPDTVRAQEARRAFVQAYAERRPQYRWHRFPLYEASGLATRALVIMWAQPKGWRAAAEALLAMAFERLNSRWDQ